MSLLNAPVITVRQPWAWLLCAGYKPVENRSRLTNYLGPVLIHASKAPVDPDDEYAAWQLIERTTRIRPWQDLAAWREHCARLPCGAIIGALTIHELRHYRDGYAPLPEADLGPWAFGPVCLLCSGPVLLYNAVGAKGAQPVPWRLKDPGVAYSVASQLRTHDTKAAAEPTLRSHSLYHQLTAEAARYTEEHAQ